MKDWIMDQNGISVEVTLPKKEAKEIIYYHFLTGPCEYEQELKYHLPATLVRIPDDDLHILMDERDIIIQQFPSNSIRIEGGKSARDRVRWTLEQLHEGKIDEETFLNIVCREITYIEFESELCRKAESKSDIIYTIAHEFAHAFLGHEKYAPEVSQDSPKIDEPEPAEIEADKLVKRWGFDKEMRESGASYLYHWDVVKKRWGNQTEQIKMEK